MADGTDGRLFLCDLALCGFSFFSKLVVVARDSLAGGAPRWAVIWWLIKEPCEARWDLRRHDVSIDPSQLLSEPRAQHSGFAILLQATAPRNYDKLRAAKSL